MIHYMQAIFGLILFINYQIIGINGRRNGAPLEACGDVTDITPNHVPFGASDNDDIPYSAYINLYDNVTYMPEMYYYCKC